MYTEIVRNTLLGYCQQLEYTMHELGGLGKKDRRQLTAIRTELRDGPVTVGDAEKILGLPRQRAARLLSDWTKHGWMLRIRRNLYIPIDLQAESPGTALGDPWVLADKVFAPCYIGGWSAVEYWHLTEQIFRTVIVITALHKKQKQYLGSQEYLLKSLPKEKHFGTTHAWRDGIKVMVSNPAKTIIDIMHDPLLGGTIGFCSEIFAEWLESEHCDFDLLIEYGDLFGNRTIFKRLGYLTEQLRPQCVDFIEACRKRISKGYSQLDPSLKGTQYVTKWQLCLPSSYKRSGIDDS